MAIIFSSPVKKQRQRFWAIILFMSLVLFLVFIMLFPLPVFNQEDNNSNAAAPSNPLKVNIDILTSDRVKNLQPFDATGSTTQNPGRSQPFAPY